MNELKDKVKEYIEAKNAGKPEEESQIREEIEAIRKTTSAAPEYVTRSDGEADLMRHKMALYRFCMRAAEKRRAEGRKQDAQAWEARGRKAISEISRKRRSGRRYLYGGNIIERAERM